MRRLVISFLIVFFVPHLCAAVPASQPASKQIAELIKQLGSTSPGERRSARDALTRLGDSAVAPLQEALRTARDQEIRNGAQVVLRRIEARNEYGPTLITLHTRGTSPQVFAEIGKQAGVKFEPFDEKTWPNEAPSPNVSADFDRVPFWEVVRQVGERCGLRPTGWYRHSPPGAAQTDAGSDVIPGVVQLERVEPHTRLRQYVSTASGPFYLYAHAFSAGKMTDRWKLEVAVLAEPKLRPVFWSIPHAIAITDDQGKPLQDQDPDPRVEPMWGRTPNLEVYLTATPAASRIARFEADTKVLVATGTQTFELDDLSKAAGTVWLWNGLRIDVEGLEEMKDGAFRLMLNVVRNNLDEARFEECYYVIRSVPVRLLDAAGRPLVQDANSMSLLSMNRMPVDHIRVFCTFIREPAHDQDPKPGRPAKLVWELPTELHAYDVPVVFTDIPVLRVGTQP